MSKKIISKRSKSAGSAVRQTRQRKQQRGRKQQRQRWYTILVIVAILILFLFALFFFGNQPAEGEIPSEALEKYANLTKYQSEEGFPTIGSMDSKVALKLFTSFDCSVCSEQINLIDQLLPRFDINSGISFQFIPIVTDVMLEFQNAEFATKFALCANQQDRFWEYQEALFSWQEFEQRAYSSARLRDGIVKLGVALNEIENCVRSRNVDAVIEAAVAAAESQLSFNQFGFPLFAVNLEPIIPNAPGEFPTIEQIQNALDRALEAETASEEFQVETQVEDNGESEITNIRPTEQTDSDTIATLEPEKTNIEVVVTATSVP